MQSGKDVFRGVGRELLRHYLNHAKLLVMPGEEKGSDVLSIVSLAVIMQLYQSPGSLLAAIYQKLPHIFILINDRKCPHAR